MGIKGYTIHCRPDSPGVVNGPRVTNGLVWAEIHHGPYMGRKLQRAGIILVDLDDATGLNSDRP